jgi:cell division protein ZapA (FtsZ GTPase activity inhibitor)
LGNLVKVEILGQEYTLRTGADEGRVLSAAELLRTKADEYQASTRSNVKLNVVILAALDLANELLLLKEAHASLLAMIEARGRGLLEALEAELEG